MFAMPVGGLFIVLFICFICMRSERIAWADVFILPFDKILSTEMQRCLTLHIGKDSDETVTMFTA